VAQSSIEGTRPISGTETWTTSTSRRGIPSAVGAYRHRLKDRIERAGMRWYPEVVQVMLDLRATYLNGAWDTFCAYHLEQEDNRRDGKPGKTGSRGIGRYTRMVPESIHPYESRTFTLGLVCGAGLWALNTSRRMANMNRVHRLPQQQQQVREHGHAEQHG